MVARARLARPNTAERPFGLELTEGEARVVAAYQRHKSIWKAGDEIGLTGQQVHAGLRKLGYSISPPPEFTSQQEAQILRFYKDTPSEDFNLAELARQLGKTRHNIARFARKHGLTRKGRQHRPETIAVLTGKPKWKDKPHPRGMAGKNHSAESKRAMATASKSTWATHKSLGVGHMSEENRQKRSERSRLMQAARPAHANYSRCKSGNRKDLGGLFVRSSWEANYARYLNLLMKMGVVERWDYEPETFWFEGIRRGTTCYRPDFRVKYKGDPKPEYIEIKGWIVAKDHVKWKRMKKYHPGIKLVIVRAKQYYALAKKWASAIPNWETQGARVTITELAL